MEGLIHWFSKNHVAANSLMVIVFVLGFGTWFGLKTEIFPEMSIDAIAVKVPYPNATPKEVETGVIIPIEEAIQDLDGIRRIRSTSAPSQAVVVIEVEPSYEIRTVMDDVNSRIDAIQNIAENAEEPVLEELVVRSQVMSIAVSANKGTDEKTLRSLAEQVREGLLSYKLERHWIMELLTGQSEVQVTQANLAGAREYEISIEVSEATLRQYGLTFDEVANAVRQSSLDLPSGSVRTEAGEVLIRTEQKRYTAPEFENITVVSKSGGSRVEIRDIAKVVDGFKENDLEARFDKRPAMLINVYRVGEQDTLKIAAAAKEYVRDVAPQQLPAGVKLEIWRDDSTYLDGRMKLLMKNGAYGLALVFVVLALFLRPSLAALVTIGIPISFAGAIMMMPYTGISINMISLFAFILVLGIVVDDAIVVGENVYRRIREGEHPRDAAPKGTHQVGIVVIFGVITTAMAFTPMLGLSGVMGKIWPNIPLIVIPTLLFSLVQSKLVLPSHLALLRPYDPNAPVGPIMQVQRFFSRGLERYVEKIHGPILHSCLRLRWVVLTGFIGVFALVVVGVVTGWVRWQFFPKVEADVIAAKLTMPDGVPFATTKAAITKIEAEVAKLNEEFFDNDGNPIVRHTLTSIGTQPFQTGHVAAMFPPTATNLGEVTVELQSAANRDVLASDIVSRWRELVGAIPGAVDLTFQSQAAGGGNAIDLELTGSDLDKLELAAQLVKVSLDEFEGVIDIASSNREGKRELKLDILPQAEALDLRLGDVSRQIRQGFYGDEVQRLQRGRDEVRVFVRYPREERQSITDLDNAKIRTKTGAEVPFADVATAELGRSYATIQRSDRRRAITITADIDESTKANATKVVAALTAEHGILTQIVEQNPDINYSFQGEQKDQAQSMNEMMIKAVIALLAMYVLMAIPLRSYVQPLIVMSVIPFGLVGAVIGHVVMDLNLNIMSMCGIIALAGVVVNDSLVLVDYVNRERAAGHDVLEAAWNAGSARFRPILLTSLTTFAGLTPMLLETDIQAKFLIPMAVSLGFGILFATAITLILIPSVYLILHDIATVGRAIWNAVSPQKTEKVA